MDDLITWLKAQIDKDENGGVPDQHTVFCGYDQIEFGLECPCGGPARVLREVAAKRRIITEWEEANRMAEADPTDVSARVARFSFTIAFQALYGVYSDRPGWISAWAL